MANINVVTVLPEKMANELSKKRKIKDYNTLPNISESILEAVREFMTDNVGYANLPIACLNANSVVDGGKEIFHYIPTNSKDGVLFVIQMPEDMIISVPYQTLLEASEDAKGCEGDEDSLEFIKEDFKEQLSVGPGDFDTDSEMIEFIPFLDYTKCKGYAVFDENFNSQKQTLNLSGVERCTLARLSAFIN